jgi:hypothetical protein
MPDGKLVIIDGTFRWRGLGERLVGVLERWVRL